jgi:hypothetical protein
MSTETAQIQLYEETPATPAVVELFVSPAEPSKAKRLVTARCCGQEFSHRFDPFDASARDRFRKRLLEKWPTIADLDGLDEAIDELPKLAQASDALAVKAAQEAAAASGQEADPSAIALAETAPEITEAAAAFLQSPEMMDELAEDLKRLGIAGETALATIEYLIGTSRLLDKPLGGSVKASSSSGKSYVTEIVTTMMPEEVVLAATEITPQALYYMAPGSLRHKVVVVGERKHMSANDEAASANATLALREMMSRGRLDKLVPMRTDAGMATAHIRQEGPIAYLETTTEQEVYEEDATRMLTLATDETPRQTAAIMRVQAEQAAWVGASAKEQEAIRAKHQTAQRLLEPLRVRIPFAPHLALPTDRLLARRAFPQFLAAIEAVALLRQYQRTVPEDGHIEADATDYEIAYSLMLPVLSRTFAPLGQRAENLLEAINTNIKINQIFNRSDCQKWAGVGLTEVRNRLTLLVEAGMVEQVTGGKGVKYTYKLVGVQEAKAPRLSALITPDALRARLEAEDGGSPLLPPAQEVPGSSKSLTAKHLT